MTHNIDQVHTEAQSAAEAGPEGAAAKEKGGMAVALYKPQGTAGSHLCRIFHKVPKYLKPAACQRCARTARPLKCRIFHRNRRPAAHGPWRKGPSYAKTRMACPLEAYASYLRPSGLGQVCIHFTHAFIHYNSEWSLIRI